MAVESRHGFPCKSCREYTGVMLDHFQNTKWCLSGRTNAEYFFPYLTKEEQRFLDTRICKKCNEKVSSGN